MVCIEVLCVQCEQWAVTVVQQWAVTVVQQWAVVSVAL